MMKIYASLLSLLMIVPLYAGEQLADVLLQQRDVAISVRVRLRRQYEIAQLKCLGATCFISSVIGIATIATGFALYPILFPTRDTSPSPIKPYRFLRIIETCGSCQDSQITGCIFDRLSNETQAYEKGVINAACSRNHTWTEWSKMYRDNNPLCESLPTAMDKIKAKCGNHTGAVPTSTITLRDKLKTKRRLMADRRAGKGI